MRWIVRLFRLHVALWLSLAVLIAVAAFAPERWTWPIRIAIGWDAGVAAFLALTFTRVIRSRSVEAIRRRAAEMDQAGAAVLPLSLLAAAASVFVIVMVAAGSRTSGATALFCMATIALSWLFTHLIFALHYAHEFYAPAQDGESDREGLMFPGEEEADYWDFLHFALVIGVANQTADVQIASKTLRRIATLHSLIAFLFNTVILALAVNLAVALL